jgi:hypothetical protein
MVDKIKAQLGALIVLSGFVGILIALWLVLGSFKDAKDVTSIMAPITTAIAGLGGAFFGVNLGQQGRERAEEDRNKAQQRAELYASQLPKEEADVIMQRAQF